MAPITEEIPDRIIAPARNLVGSVIGVLLRAHAIDPHAGAVADQA